MLEVLNQFVSFETLPPQTKVYLMQLFEEVTTRHNLTQTRVRRNKEGKHIDAGYILLALHLHNLTIDHIQRTTPQKGN